MEPTSDLTHSIVSERLRFVDVLVRAGRIGDAIKEIDEIKHVDPANPYARAYEERLQTMRPPVQPPPECTPANVVQHTSPDRSAPAPREIALEPSPQEFAACVTGQIVGVLHTPERPQPNVSGSADGMQSSPDQRSVSRASIVLVDDDEFLLEALVELLEDSKYATKSFTKCEDALEYMKGHKPDLVLCDVNLRNSSFGGFTLFEKITKLGHLHNVPFVFMSGIVDQAIIRAGKELGADDYLTKPFEPDMLLSVVKGKLRKYKLIQKNR
jgi:CheY-like chemotaxis protein